MVGLIFMVNLAFAQTDTVSTTDEVFKIIDGVTERVSAGVAALSKSLEVPAKHVYRVMVKQQIVTSITWLIVLVVGLFGLSTGISLWNTGTEKSRDSDAVENIMGGIMIAVSIIMTIFGILNIETIVSGIVNPEYNAIIEIMNFLK